VTSATASGWRCIHWFLNAPRRQRVSDLNSVPCLFRAAQASLKGFLVDMMSEMRQPLTGIQAATQLLAQRPCIQQDEEGSFLVAAISAASQMLMVRANRLPLLPGAC
jgi:hypothetical protein